uniref:DUF1985 domain-containing protein n=1 Tax=Brassica oleracea var. oleracea TaxID=109376 RepID=A0A0D3A4F5_BRAOL
MLGFQLDIKKKYELWSLVGPQPVRFSLLEFEHLTGLNCEYIEDLERPHCAVTEELTSLWEMLGVHVEAGPSTQEIIATFERCEGWSRDDRTRLAYLAIFTGYIEGRKYSTPTRVLMDSVKGRDISGCYTINGFAQALQVWVYTALPELGATFGNPLPNNPSPPILAYKGRKGRRQFKETILSQTRVIKFVQKDIGEMFSKWEFDVEDTSTENIIKFMFVKKPWKWTMDCWEVTGTWVNTKPGVVSPRPRKKTRKEAGEEAAAEASEEVHAVARSEVTTTVGGLTKEDIKTMFKDIVDARPGHFGYRFGSIQEPFGYLRVLIWLPFRVFRLGFGSVLRFRIFCPGLVDAMREGFGTCLKEIKYMSERVEAMEKNVGITTKRKGTSA